MSSSTAHESGSGSSSTTAAQNPHNGIFTDKDLESGNGSPQYQNNSNNGWGAYGGNPLAHMRSAESARLPAFAGYLQPGLYRRPTRKIGNPAPLGLFGFALTTFLLSLLNWHTRGVSEPNLVVGAAFAYGGLIQILAGMWEMAAANTFGATALTSYGGFWISLAIVLTPGGFEIMSSYKDPTHFAIAFSFFLFGWFIFTVLMWLMTLKSTVVFCLLFFWVWLTFLMLALAYYYCDATGTPNVAFQKAGGMFGLLAGFTAWYVALAGVADDSNSFFTIPVWHFPWSEKGKAAKAKTEELKA